jgi:sulfatase maturation enzyme AslB (radical SAM superfamily)
LLAEIKDLQLGTREIGFTGGEPFMNPQMLDMARACLENGHEVLILTNAMAPMQRPACKTGLLDLKAAFGDKLTLRISIDHHSAEMHDTERGAGSFEKTLIGVDWLAQNGFSLAIAGRSIWTENEVQARQGYEALFKARNWPIDAYNKAQTVLFPEMDEKQDVPEITTACWGILNLDPMAMMCATSRMVVKRKGEDEIKVMPCTLLPYDAAFEMGTSLKQSLKANEGNFAKGAVKLNHPHCAKFCVLGGGSCSG